MGDSYIAHNFINVMKRATRLELVTPNMEWKRETGIEPATPGLGSRCSTIELLAH
jgi:hypothetical protein